MLAEQDNCDTNLPNKTKVGLQGEVFCVWPGPWKWNPVFKKKKGLAEQDNFNTDSTKKTTVGLWSKNKDFCAIKLTKRQVT